jgi:hypothetical protein
MKAVRASLAHHVIRQLVALDEHGTILGSRSYETAKRSNPASVLVVLKPTRYAFHKL